MFNYLSTLNESLDISEKYVENVTTVRFVKKYAENISTTTLDKMNA